MRKKFNSNKTLNQKFDVYWTDENLIISNLEIYLLCLRLYKIKAEQQINHSVLMVCSLLFRVIRCKNLDQLLISQK
jgi:hypothetical protein